MDNCLPLFFSASDIDLIGEDDDECLEFAVPENHQREGQADVPPRIRAPQRLGLPPAYTGPPPPTFASSPFGTSTPSTMFASPSSGVFGAPQASSPFSFSTTFGASSPGFGSSTPAFGASSSPSFGSSASPFRGTSTFGSSTPFGATSTHAFGATSTPAFGASSTPSFSFGSSRTFGQSTSSFGSGSTPPLFGSNPSLVGTPTQEPRRMEFGYKSVNNQNDVVARVAKYVMSTIAKGSNLVFSPTSINVLLGLVAAGANDVTKHHILSFLRSPSADHLCLALAAMADVQERTNSCLCVANGVWIHEQVTLKPSFKKLLENSYKATCTQVDFASKPLEVIDEVNAWAEENTKGLIKQVLSKEFHVNMIRESKLILANAIYFKGSWDQKFEANLTQDANFHLLNGKTTKVPFMSNRKDQYLGRYNGFQVMKLPYVEDHRQFSMYIYLPDDKDGFPALLERMVSESGFLDNHIPKWPMKVDFFRIPKFKISYEFEVSEILKEMGLTSPFEGGLTEMIVNSSSNDEEPRVSGIIHKSFIEVDEKGTEAAAVTITSFIGACFMPHREYVRFEADHPFLFTIREDKSGVILFMGQVLDPTN